MPEGDQLYPEFCRVCGKPDAEVGKLSSRGKCNDCAASNVEQAITQMTDRAGPIHDKWAERIVAGVTRAA